MRPPARCRLAPPDEQAKRGRRAPSGAHEKRGKGEPAMEHLSFPNERADYRQARNALLDAEIELRRQIERVAAQRRALPPGGEVLTDYVFERLGANLMPEQVKLSELFGDHPSILLYSFMYGP